MFGLVPFDRSKKNQLQNSEDRIFNMDRIFENFFNDALFPSFYSQSGLMRVNIRETDAAYELEAELPGVAKDQISIDLDADRLTISVNQDEKSEEKNERFIRRERRCCSMTRSFSVDNVDTEKITAKMEHGILYLTLPKKEQVKPQGRKIDIG